MNFRQKFRENLSTFSSAVESTPGRLVVHLREQNSLEHGRTVFDRTLHPVNDSAL